MVDANTWKPIQESGFDSSTWKPLEAAPVTLGEKQMADIKENNPVSAGYSLGKNIVPLIKNLMDKYRDQQSVMNSPLENVVGGLKETALPLAKDTLKSLGDIVTHPNEKPMSAAMLAIPFAGSARGDSVMD